jgi:4-amino-4-deoxy-L-arabinose transferase-like glycosyltransferase
MRESLEILGNTMPFIGIRVLILLLASLAGLSLLTTALVPLALDEAYYWYWAQYPDIGYFDHPPLIAWLIALSTALGGDSEFAVRLGGFLLLWSGFGFAFFTLRVLFPNAAPQAAWEYLLLLNLTLIFPGATMVHTIDTPLLAFWMGALYFGARVVMQQDARAWYGVGVCLGLGMLSKYTMVLFAPLMLLFVLFSPSHRHWLTRKEPWLAALLSVLIFSPVIVWNWQYDWLSFDFQLNHGFAPDDENTLNKIFGYVVEQAVVISPLLFVLFLIYGSWGAGYALKRGGAAYLYLVLLSWPVILFFGYSSVSGSQAEANWPAPAYAAGLLLAWMVYRQHFWERKGHGRFVVGALAISLALALAIRSHLLHPWLPIPPQQDRVGDALGWPELGVRINAIIAENPHPQGYFLAAGAGTRLAEGVYYTGGQYIGVDFIRPERYLFLDDPNAELRGKNAVILDHYWRPRPDTFQRYFRKVTPLNPFEFRFKGVELPDHRVELYLGEEFLGNWVEFDQLKQGAVP